MSVQFCTDFRAKHLYILVTGTFNLRSMKKMIQESIRTAQESGLTKIMIDCSRLSGYVATINFFILGEFIAEQCHLNVKMYNCKIVIIAYDQLYDPDLLMETVANNRGTKMFIAADLEEAHKWLKSSK